MVHLSPEITLSFLIRKHQIIISKNHKNTRTPKADHPLSTQFYQSLPDKLRPQIQESPVLSHLWHLFLVSGLYLYQICCQQHFYISTTHIKIAFVLQLQVRICPLLIQTFKQFSQPIQPIYPIIIQPLPSIT